MNSKLKFITILAVASLLVGCAAGPHMQALRTADFASYDTFYWLPTRTPTVIHNPIVDSAVLSQRVRRAVARTLTSHGYREVERVGNADFIVSYGVSTEPELRGTTFGAGFGYMAYSFDPDLYYPGFYFPFNPGGYTTFQTYQQAHLIVNIMDGRTHQLVWRGWNTMRVSAENFSREHVFEVVRTILTRFPPTASAAA